MKLAIFILLQLLNVILSTIRSICTIKFGKFIAALSNAVYFSVYTFIVFYTVSDDLISSLFLKALITFLCNAVGVYFSKWLLEKFEKENLWEIVATLKRGDQAEELHQSLNSDGVGNNYNLLDNGEAVFRIYSKTKEDSRKTKKLLLKYNAKHVVHKINVFL